MKKRFLSRVLATGGLIFGMVGMANASIITNGVLTVGINDNGTINDRSEGIGITYTEYPSADFTYPGTPLQYYSIGISGDWGANSSANDDDISISTTTISEMSADTYGSYGDLSFHQNMTLEDERITFSVTFTNLTDQDLNDVAYASGFDPDQDYYTDGDYKTNNTILPGQVTAIGPSSGATISIVGEGTGSISRSWSRSPYYEYDDGNGDNTIAMIWDLGVINAGDSKSIDFSYDLEPVPVPAAIWLLGSGLAFLAGIGGKKSKKIRS